MWGFGFQSRSAFPPSLAWKWDQTSITSNPSKGELASQRAAQQYTFAQIWGMHVQTAELYREVGLPIVRRVFEGYNGCVMAYGQTNSGCAAQCSALEA